MTVVRGPAIGNPPDRLDTQLTASLRLLSHYRIQTDQFETRADVLINNKPEHGQFRIGMDGDQFSGSIVCLEHGDFMIPEKGMTQTFGIKAHPQDLIDLLRGLADELDKAWKR